MAEFKNQDINKKFIITGEDRIVQLPEGYRGTISEIPREDFVAAMVQRKSPLVKIKPVDSAAATEKK